MAVLNEQVEMLNTLVYGNEKNKIIATDDNPNIIAPTDEDTVLVGNNIDNIISGNAGDDNLYAKKGNDILYGNSGNDILKGGEGNDKCQGGHGNDTYVFGKGCGVDTVLDYNGENKIKFLDEITQNDLELIEINDYDVELKIKGTEDKIIIKNFKRGSIHANFNLEFSNGESIHISKFGKDKNKIIATDDNPNIVAPTDENTVLVGNNIDNIISGNAGDDKLYAKKGNDILYGNSGNDILKGGEGNDKCEGGHGNDTYVFGKGCGVDTILDYNGKNKIKFLDEITQNDLELIEINDYDVELKIKGTQDKIIIKNFKLGSIHANFNLEFSNGESIHISKFGKDKNKIIATDSNPNISAPTNQNTILVGNDSNNIITGNVGNDKLYGKKGNDTLIGNSGNDILNGGEGNDTCQGGNGNDTYIFKKGHGVDTILDYNGENKIKFGENITKGDLLTDYVNNDLEILVGGIQDKIIIKNFKLSSMYKNFDLEFANGEVIDIKDFSEKTVVKATDYAPNIYGLYGKDTILIGNDKVNSIYGNSGNDKLYGKKGNDTLIGNNGNDILNGGAGDDTCQGGHGNDTYVFGKGDGVDTILDYNGENKIKFTGNITLNNISVKYLGKFDTEISIIGRKDKIIIKNFKTAPIYRNFALEFSDGTFLAADDKRNPFNSLGYMSFNSKDINKDIINENADMLGNIYNSEGLEPSDSNIVNNNACNVCALADKKMQVLTESMSGFSNDSNISWTDSLDNTQNTENSVQQIWIDSVS